MKRIKTAVVGCGSISDIYMTNLTNGKFTVMELVACSDLMVERMNASAAKFGIKAMSLDEICADPEIEMVICLTTPAAHYPIIKQALLAGKHVFSEKMIAVDLWQGKELVQIANEKGLHLGVAPDTFLGASVQTAKYIVDKGLIGKPLSCRASISRDYGIYAEFLTHLAKKGAGIGFDMGGYYLTALAAILGPVRSVAAFTATNDPASQYAAGVVVDQSPLPEKQAKVGSTIKLTVSAGVSETKMPPLVNLTRQNAEQQLNALGLNLNIQIEERKDDIYTEGYVIQTDPSSGTPLTSGQTVTLTVSLGPDIELTEVPTLVGEDVDKALQMIADAGLQNGSIRSDDSDLPAGTVTFQSIDGGQMVKKDTVINLRVSKGPQEAETPVVTNLTQDQAVLQGDTVTLSISAYSADDGTLRYAWYMSSDGSYENAALVSRSREGNTTCEADTSAPGTYYYFCVVENSLGDDTKTTKSNMIEVVVQEKTVEKTIEVTLPGKSGLYELTVYVDGVLQYGPSSVSVTDDHAIIAQVTVRGKGTLPVDVYLDGALYDSQLILFE